MSRSDSQDFRSDLSGLPLLAARVAWGVIFLTSLAIVFFSIPVLLEHFEALCRTSGDRCIGNGRLTPEVARTFAEIGIPLRAHAVVMVGVNTLSRMVWVAVGTLIFLRRSGDPMALLVSAFLITFGTATFATEGVDALISSNPAWWIPGRGLQVLGEVGAMLFFLLFPTGYFAPRWTRWLAVAFLVYQVPQDLFPNFYSSLSIPDFVQSPVFIGLVLGMVGTQVYRYRNVYASHQRRQTRWVIAGATLSICALFSLMIPLFFLPSIWTVAPIPVLYMIGLLGPLTMLPIPLSVGVAMLRSGLFDIDVVVNRALVYATLTATLAIVYVSGVVGSQRLLSPLFGESNQIDIVVSTLVIAALFNPLRRRIQAIIDRRFYRKKYDAKKTLEDFSVKLRDETDLERLNAELLSVVRETVQPSHVSLWVLLPERGAKR